MIQMKTRLLISLTLVSIIAFIPSVKAEEGKTYQIRMERPEKPGKKFDVTVISNSVTSQQSIKDGAVVKESRLSFGGTLQCTEEVMAVGKNGEVTKSKFVVQKFTVTKTLGKEEASFDALEPGQILIWEMDGDSMQITNNVKFGDPDSPRVLAYMFQRMNYVIDMKEDVIFDTETPRAIGQEWGVDLKNLKSGLPVGSLYEKISEDKSSGQVKFEKLDASNPGAEAAVISAKFKLVAMAMKRMEDAKLQNASLEIEFNGRFPLDMKIPPLSIETNVKENFTFDMKDEADEKGEIRNIREIVTKATRKLKK